MGRGRDDPRCCLAKLCCSSIAVGAMGAGSPPGSKPLQPSRGYNCDLSLNIVTGQLKNIRGNVVGRRQGLLLSPGLVGAELKRIPALLAAASPFPDLALKAQ